MPATLLIQFAVKSAIVLAAAWAVTASMRHGSAAGRHLVWTIGIVATLALPLVGLAGPAWFVAVPASLAFSGDVSTGTRAVPPLSGQVPVDSTRAAAVASAPAPVSADEPLLAGTAQRTAGRAPLGNWGPVFGIWNLAATVWLFGVGLGTLRLALGMLRVRRIALQAVPVTDRGWLAAFDEAATVLKLTRRVPLRQTGRTTVPVACGIWRSSVLLPADAMGWSPERRLVVLLHELAHVRRRDCLVQWLAQVTCVLHWMNPLAHVAVARLRAEQERACDDLVLASGTDAPAYADHLFEIARAFRSSGVPAWATLTMARPSQLEGRVIDILDDRRNRRPMDRRARAAVAVAAGVAVVVLGALQVSAASEAAEGTSAGTPVAAPATAVAAPLVAEGQTPAPPAPPPIMTNIGPLPADDADPMPARGPAPVPPVTRVLVADGQQPPLPPPTPPPTPLPSLPPSSPPSAVTDETRRRVADALATALNDTNESVREQALNGLASMRDARAIPALVQALRDPSADLRERAVTGLAQFDTPEATEAMVSALKDSSPAVRARAARYVGLRLRRGQLQEPKYVDLLMGLLADPVPDVREEAAMTLGRQGSSRSVPALIPLLKDTNKDVRERTAQALGMIADPAAIDPLTAALKDADADVRAQAALALAQIARGQRRDNRSGPVPPLPPARLAVPRPPAGRPQVKLDLDVARIEAMAQRIGQSIDTRTLEKLAAEMVEQSLDTAGLETMLERLQESLKAAGDSLSSTVTSGTQNDKR